MNTDTARIVAALRRLAEAAEVCPGDNTIHEGCFVCNGTGRVALFRATDGKALFRKECVGSGGTACPVSGAPLGNPMPNVKGEPERCICRGLGWLHLDLDEVHLEMLLFLAINNEHESLAGGQLFHTVMSALEARARSAKTEQDLIEAAILALDAAMEARA